MNLNFILASVCPFQSKNINQYKELFHVTAAAKQALLRHKNESAAKAVFIVYYNKFRTSGKGDFK